MEKNNNKWSLYNINISVHITLFSQYFKVNQLYYAVLISYYYFKLLFNFLLIDLKIAQLFILNFVRSIVSFIF